MAKESVQTLSYASPENRPGRFRHVKAIFPFGGGLLLGGLFAGVILAAAPRFFVADVMTDAIQAFALVFGAGFVAVYALVVLLLIGCFSTSSREQSPKAVCRIVGLCLPVLGIGMEVTKNVTSIVLSPPDSLVQLMDWAAFSVAGLAAIVAPLFLVQWRERPLPKELGRQWPRSFLKTTAVGAILLAVMLGIGRWAADKRYDRDCEDVAAWVKNTHPIPGVYSNLALPASQRLLTPDHCVYAVVLPDGRVVVMLKTSLGWHHNWEGFSYASGPIAASEITDAYGSPRIRINGLPFHFVRQQLDSQHFVVAFNLG